MAVWFAVFQVATLVAILVALYRPLGDYMATIYTSRKDLKVERGFYRLIGVDARSDQTWQAYLRGVLAFSAIGLLFVYAIQRAQAVLPYSLGFPAIPEGLSFNTAASFVANTNWQSYSPDVTMGYAVQLTGLAVQNFVSASVGIAVAIALVRGFALRKTGTIGNFWVDLTRGTLRLLLPISAVGAIVLIAGGVIQNFNGFTEIATLGGGTQSLPGGPTASQEVIKLLGTNGGGFFNTNSSHPFENPTAWTSLLQNVLMLAIPFSLPRTFGAIVGDRKQGYAILAAMATIFLVSLTALTIFEMVGAGTAPMAAGGAMEGKEQRFGIAGSTLFATTSTLTSTGAVNSMHDSYTALGGMMPMINMMLGEVALRVTLGARGYDIVTAQDGTAAINATIEHHPDLVMLDLGMPHLNGLEVITTLRGWTQVPILVVSGRTGASDKVEALDAGADDYVTKPFSIDELLARIRALTRRVAAPDDEPVVVLGSVTVDLAAKQIVRKASGNPEPIRLTPTEWRILEVLIRNPGKLVTRESLLTEVWGPHHINDTGYLRLYLAQLQEARSRPIHTALSPHGGGDGLPFCPGRCGQCSQLIVLPAGGWLSVGTVQWLVLPPHTQERMDVPRNLYDPRAAPSCR